MTYVAKEKLLFQKEDGVYIGLFWVNKTALRELEKYGFVIDGKVKLIKTLRRWLE